MTKLLLAILLTSTAAVSGVAGRPTPAGAELAVRFKPVIGPDGRATAMQVTETVTGLVAAGPIDLSAPSEFEGVQDVANRIVDLAVRDRSGLVPVTLHDEAPKAGETKFLRHWHSDRPVSYPVTISYLAKVQPDGSPGGPPMGLRPSGGGIASAGGGFLVLPNVATRSTTVDWDLSTLPTGSIGVISAGEGHTVLPGASDKLMDQWIFAGPAGRYDATPAVPLHAYWLGKPPFDPDAEMRWVGRAYGHLAKSFGYLDPAPTYRVFIKQLDARPFGGGTALPGAFLMSIGPTFGKGQDLTEMHLTYIHEMTHQWVGHMATDATWFSEGMTVYYTAAYGLSGGLLTREEYGREINSMARKYYSSPARTWPESKIQKLGFSEEGARQVPYGRGALYFANLNAALLAASGGRSGLDAFVRPLFAARAAGTPLTIERWEAALTNALGPAAVRDFRAQIIDATEVMMPRADIFGVCYKVATIPGAGAQATLGGYEFQPADLVRCR